VDAIQQRLNATVTDLSETKEGLAKELEAEKKGNLPNEIKARFDAVRDPQEVRKKRRMPWCSGS